ncbi:osmoprotectant transport system permease protein [Gracilibacillus halotolerans]|uniref:Osmoprotectant transport system permease protein n=1 Tax=Gracilibacillus halotolerans TaxID=74386 RepID=A0A841RK25_9BACI|nr:osmoprotectant transport system permease protein [Gracilibacillus halotolerans]
MRDYNYLTVFVDRAPTLLNALGEHLFMTIVAVLLGCIVSIPLGIYLTRTKVEWIRSTTFTIANIFQTIPSLAMLGILLPLLGVGLVPAIVALFLYSLMPVLRNTYAGFNSIDQGVIQSAIGMGYSPAQRLLQIELPLAIPYIMSGIRLTTVYIINWATLATLIGAGGLGEPIISGLGVYDKPLIFAAAALSMLLALAADFLLGLLEKAFFKKNYGKKKKQMNTEV